MDGLFSKYARPFSFINGMILTNRFSEFVDEFWKLEKERTEWEFYLHKIFNQSYAEWKESFKQNQPVSDKQIETTVNDSKSILMNFVPE